jgi:hypothetical protein
VNSDAAFLARIMEAMALHAVTAFTFVLWFDEQMR